VGGWEDGGYMSSSCPICGGEGVVMTKPPGAGHSDDLAEYEPCVCRERGHVEYTYIVQITIVTDVECGSALVQKYVKDRLGSECKSVDVIAEIAEGPEEADEWLSWRPADDKKED
jgi:hypothetical protein